MSGVDRVSPSRVLLVSFLGQALACGVVWLVVNDRPELLVPFSTRDHGEWLRGSVLLAALAALAGGVALRRARATFAVIAGCLLAVVACWTVFVAAAVLGSA